MRPDEPLPTWCALPFGLAVALLLGSVAGEIARPRYMPPPLPAMPTARAASDAALPTLDEGLGRAFGVPEPERIVEPAPSASPAREPAALALRLLGTVVADRPQWSRALVRDPAAERLLVLRLGDHVDGWVVVAIERDPLRVVLEDPRTGQEALLRPGEPATRPAPTAPSPSALPGVERRSDTDYRVDREALRSALASPEALLTGARALPSMIDGRMQGFRVQSIRAGSLYDSLGLRNGDLVSAVNGLVIDTPDKALELLTRLRDARFVEVDLQRAGRPLRMRYEVR